MTNFEFFIIRASNLFSIFHHFFWLFHHSSTFFTTFYHITIFAPVFDFFIIYHHFSSLSLFVAIFPHVLRYLFSTFSLHLKIFLNFTPFISIQFFIWFCRPYYISIVILPFFKIFRHFQHSVNFSTLFHYFLIPSTLFDFFNFFDFFNIFKFFYTFRFYNIFQNFSIFSTSFFIISLCFFDYFTLTDLNIFHNFLLFFISSQNFWIFFDLFTNIQHILKFFVVFAIFNIFQNFFRKPINSLYFKNTQVSS